MKGQFEVNPQSFRAAVSWAARWVAAKPTSPIFGGILLEVADGRLTASGYNEDVSASATEPVEGDAAGMVVVSGRLLDQLVDTFPDKPVTVYTDGPVLAVKAGKVTVTLPLMAETDYPTLPPLPPAVATLPGSAFARAAHRVAVAATRDLTRTQWVAVHMAFEGDVLEMVASDSYRAARAELPYDAAPDRKDDGPCTALVAAATLADIGKAFADLGHVTVGISDSLFGCSTEDRSITSRLTGGEYKSQPVARLCLADPPNAAVVGVSDLTRTVKRAALMHKETPQPTLSFGADVLAVGASGEAEGARADDEIECAYDGPQFTVTVNPHYLLEALGAAGSKSVRVAFDPAYPYRPLLVTDPDDPTYRHVVVPIRKR